MKVFMITGTSRGLGEAMVKRLFSSDHHLVCISRKKNDHLIKEAANNQTALDYYECDLHELHSLDALMERIFHALSSIKIDALYLINNAGVVQPIAPAHKNTSEEIERNIHVNLIAPMILTANFIKLAYHLKIEKRILNISSGAGRNPYEGWSSYCAAKAGLDHFTRCVAKEQQKEAFGARIVSLAPGIIDTDMQKEIRSTHKEDFTDLNKFIQYKKEGQLSQAQATANKIIDLLCSTSFGNQGHILDIRKIDRAE